MILATQSGKTLHSNFTFAHGKFAKLNFCLFLDFQKRFAMIAFINEFRNTKFNDFKPVTKIILSSVVKLNSASLLIL